MAKKLEGPIHWGRPVTVAAPVLNMAGLAAARMFGGSEFHAADPACEKARSPNLVRTRFVTYLLHQPEKS